MHAAAEFGQEKLELEALQASGIFHRAPNLALLLTYVCARYFEGSGEQIKEYNIAVEALGRPADFDQKRDSIVRVEAHRLRKRLREYYEAEGADHALRIDIPPGQYAPRFLRRGVPEAGLSSEALVAQPELSSADTQADTQMLPGSGALLVPVEFVPAEFVPVEFVPVERASSALAMPGVAIESGHGRRNAVAGVMLLLVFSAGAVALINGSARKTTNAAGSPISKTPAPDTPVQIAGSQELRILAGHQSGDYTDRLGRVWLSDRYFQGGYVFESADHPISGTREPRIYQSRREGTFGYDIPLPPGVYELRLHFAETLYGENNAAGGGESSRVFNVSINGEEALHEFDVLNEAGPSAADVRAFKDISPAADGKLHLKFDPFSNPPLLSAIEITPGIPKRLRPIRMISLERHYTDKQGRVWEPDGYARGGQLVWRTKPVETTTDPELFRGERFGNLRYVIPVPPGRYGVTLYFAEAWFGPGTPAGGGAGSRLFHILCNGLALRHNFDIYKEARGGGRAATFSAHGLEPDARGKLNISLEPTRNYACVNAIEVLDESK
jgi:Malectin domain